jgi:hypothetical protein
MRTPEYVVVGNNNQCMWSSEMHGHLSLWWPCEHPYQNLDGPIIPSLAWCPCFHANKQIISEFKVWDFIMFHIIKEQEMQCKNIEHAWSVLVSWILAPAYSLRCFLGVCAWMHAAGGRVGDAAAGRDLPLPGCQDGGDPRALPPGLTGKAIRTHVLAMHATATMVTRLIPVLMTS